jgi:RNA recognition motif-containing protein
VKNLPYAADSKELLEMFSQYGEVQSLEMPESQ